MSMRPWLTVEQIEEAPKILRKIAKAKSIINALNAPVPIALGVTTETSLLSPDYVWFEPDSKDHEHLRNLFLEAARVILLEGGVKLTDMGIKPPDGCVKWVAG